MALLLGGLHYDKINILRGWHSDKIMTYLHTSTPPCMQGFSTTIVTHSGYAHISANLGAEGDGDGDA